MALNQLSIMMLDAAKGKKRGDALRAVAAAYCEYVKQSPEMYRIIMKIPHSHSEDLIKTGRAVKSILFDVLSQYTKEDDKIILYSRYYHSILHGFVSLNQTGFFDDAFPIDTSLSNIINNFIEHLERI